MPFHTLADSWRSFAMPIRLLSATYGLFCKKRGGGGIFCPISTGEHKAFFSQMKKNKEKKQEKMQGEGKYHH